MARALGARPRHCKGLPQFSALFGCRADKEKNSAESGGLCTKNKQQDHPGGSKKAWCMLSIYNHNNKHIFFWFGRTSTCKVSWLGDGLDNR